MVGGRRHLLEEHRNGIQERLRAAAEHSDLVQQRPRNVARHLDLKRVRKLAEDVLSPELPIPARGDCGVRRLEMNVNLAREIGRELSLAHENLHAKQTRPSSDEILVLLDDGAGDFAEHVRVNGEIDNHNETSEDDLPEILRLHIPDKAIRAQARGDPIEANQVFVHEGAVSTDILLAEARVVIDPGLSFPNVRSRPDVIEDARENV
mmetsp:Transcript_23737/g.77178  ORF Transcript_23737/g.77178 Transcript_23737/m.77178 type:complete len:207 (-) Transcript_23737:4076-4696(-)